MKEAAAASYIRLDAAQQGIELFRNNVGVLPNQNGTPVRYGLCNESAAMNREIKSSDYIGIQPVYITPEMVGTIVGVAIAIETKDTDWTFPEPSNKKEYERCVAQSRFHDIVRKAGGRAGFACTVEEFRKICRI